jgi:N-acetylglucosamine-6-phosphate deacetylase
MVIEVATGIVTILGLAIPLFYKWRRLQNEENSKVSVAPDSPKRNAFVERMRKRKAKLRAGSSKCGDGNAYKNEGGL